MARLLLDRRKEIATAIAVFERQKILFKHGLVGQCTRTTRQLALR